MGNPTNLATGGDSHYLVLTSAGVAGSVTGFARTSLSVIFDGELTW